jgi:hypothetical protein
MATTLRDPLFTATMAEELTAQAMGQLMAGTLGALSIADGLNSDECRTVADAADRLPPEAYDSDRVQERIIRFGPALNDYRSSGGLNLASYWQQVDLARSRWADLRLPLDPMSALLGRISDAWGSPVAPATIDGRPVWGMTIREISAGSLVHYDEIAREAPTAFDQTVVTQLAVNAWASAPIQGGETRIWRKRWQPSDQRFASGYGYMDVVVFTRQQLTLRPQLGDLTLFCPSWYHQVTPVSAGRRISLSCFLGYTLDGQLICWS